MPPELLDETHNGYLHVHISLVLHIQNLQAHLQLAQVDPCVLIGKECVNDI